MIAADKWWNAVHDALAGLRAGEVEVRHAEVGRLDGTTADGLDADEVLRDTLRLD